LKPDNYFPEKPEFIERFGNNMGKNYYFVAGVITCEEVDISSYLKDVLDYFDQLELEKGEKPNLYFATKKTNAKPSGLVVTESFTQNVYTVGAWIVAAVTLYQTSSDFYELVTERLDAENIKQGLAFIASHPNAKKAVEYFCERWGWKVNYLKLSGKLSEDKTRSDKESVSPNANVRKNISQELRTEKERLAEAMTCGDENEGEQILNDVIRFEKEGMNLADKSPAYIAT